MDNIISRASDQQHDKDLPVLINMIPNELLVMIFICLRKVVTQDYTGFRSWLSALMHACHHWRKVALESSQCWTQLEYFASQEIVKMFLDRSNQAELSITLNNLPEYEDQSDDKTNKYFGLSLEQNTRIKELHVTDYPESEATWSPIMRLLDRSAPSLQVLSLASPYIFFFTTAAPKLILSPLTPEALPALRYLSLSDICIRWNSAKFRNLTSLRLKSLRQGFRPSLSQILDILEDSPFLERLDLDNTAPDDSSIITSRSEPVVMGKLYRLDLSSLKYSTFLALMNHLKFDRQITWSVWCSDYPAHIASAPLNSSLVQHTDSSDTIEIAISNHYLSVSGFRNQNKVSHIFFRFSQDLEQPHPIFQRVVGYILNTPWSQAREVRISAEVDDPKDADNIATWLHLFQAIPYASHLDIDFLNENCDEFPEAFANALERTDIPEDGDTSHYPLPLLATLVLRHVDFSEDSTFFDTFLKCIEKRNKHNLHLEVLVVRSSFGYSEERITTLSEHVGKVFWEEIYVKFNGEICRSRKEYKLRKEQHSLANPNPLIIDLTPFHG